MQTAKNTNAKKSTAKNQNAEISKTEKKETVLKTINLNKFAEQLKNVPDEKIRADRSLIYKYPETYSKSDINGEKGKKFRSNLRNKLNRFNSNIFTFAKREDVENLKKEVESFDAFYTENYMLQNYEVSSVTSKTEDKSDLQLMFDIIKDVKANA